MKKVLNRTSMRVVGFLLLPIVIFFVGYIAHDLDLLKLGIYSVASSLIYLMTIGLGRNGQAKGFFRSKAIPWRLLAGISLICLAAGMYYDVFWLKIPVCLFAYEFVWRFGADQAVNDAKPEAAI
jgi:hypothetical protein